MLKSAVLDFKNFEGSTTGERIYEDILVVLQKYQGETEDTIVFDTIGITDTTGNMGKLGKYLRENGKEHGYCTDHNLHLVAKLAFDREISCGICVLCYGLMCHLISFRKHFVFVIRKLQMCQQWQRL